MLALDPLHEMPVPENEPLIMFLVTIGPSPSKIKEVELSMACLITLREDIVMLPLLNCMGSEAVPIAVNLPFAVIECPFRFTIAPGSISKVAPLSTVTEPVSIWGLFAFVHVITCGVGEGVGAGVTKSCVGALNAGRYVTLLFVKFCPA